ncbi:hypothetical protein Y032_0023g820 [Ancylostoma ceylanicum]|nr:hypothetical protein Y032_0023g820 [Ancylostoma ceylanicum]
MTMWLFRTVIKQAFIALCVICCTTSLQEGESMRQGHIRVLSFLACVSCAFCITCYECTSSQGQECKYTATSCQYGFFGCVKIAAFSGGVDKMGMWYDQDRRIITMIRGCAILPFGGVDMCEQTSILGVRVLKCTCFNDYCNSSRTFSTYGVVIGVFLATLIGTFGPPAAPTSLTRTALSANRPCIMALTLLEVKQMGEAGCPNVPIRVDWLRPFFLMMIHTREFAIPALA